MTIISSGLIILGRTMLNALLSMDLNLDIELLIFLLVLSVVLRIMLLFLLFLDSLFSTEVNFQIHLNFPFERRTPGNSGVLGSLS